MFEGFLEELIPQYDDKKNIVQYKLQLEGKTIPLNALVGKSISIEFLGKIHCVDCKKSINESYNGSCYDCSISLPKNDLCIVKPERCHFLKGTCRDQAWGVKNCFIEHSVYLSNTSELKVGITKSKNLMKRWMDQGATQAIELLCVKKRKDAGIIEEYLKKQLSDKTNWRKMVSGASEHLDLTALRDDILKTLPENLVPFFQKASTDAKTVILEYPVETYPKNPKNVSLFKEKNISGRLLGIKGQYLLFDDHVLSIKKHLGFLVNITI